LKEEEDRIVK